MADYNLGTARGKIEIDSSGATKGAAEATAAIDKTRAAGDKAAAGVGKAGTVLLGAGVAIAAGFAVAVKSAADFEQRMSAVKAVSGASQKEMDQLSAKALQLGKDTSFSATEAASAIEELVKAGISVPDVMNGAADATVALAAAGEVSLPEAATLAANAMNSFGLSAAEMPKVADLIAGAANASAIDVGEFGQALQQVGAVAHLAGVSFADTSTAIALLGNAGIKGSDAGTSLKTMFQRLIPQTDKQKAAMEKLGLITKDGANQFFDAQGKVKSLSDVSQILQTSLKGMTKEQKLATLQTLFGADAIRGAAVLADAGSAGFDKMAASMGKVKAADVAKTRMDNLKGSLEQLKGSLETAGIVIGQVLLPAIRGFVDAVTGLLNKFLSLTPEQQKFILQLIAGAAAFALYAGAALKISAAIAKMRAATAAAGGAATLLKAAFSAGWIGLVIIAIGLLVAGIILLWKNSETFRTIVLAVWHAIQAVVLAVVTWITGTAIPALTTAWNAIVTGLQVAWAFIQTAWAGIQATIATVVAVIKPIIASIWNGIQAGVAIAQTAFAAVSTFVGEQAAKIKAFLADAWLMLGPPLTAAFNTAKAIFTAAFGFISAAVTTFIAFVTAAWNIFGPAITAIINVAWTNIKGIFSVAFAVISAMFSVWFAVVKAIVSVGIAVIVAVMQGAWTIIKAAASAAWTLIKGIIGGALDIILGIVKLAIALLTGNWGKAWEAIKQIFKGALTIITSVVQAAMTLVGGIIKAAIGVIKAVVTSGWNAIKSVSTSVWNAIKSVASAVWNAIKANISAAINAVKAVISSNLNAIKAVFGSTWNAVKSGVTSAWNGIKSAISTGISAGMSLIRGFKDKIVGFFSGAGSWLVSAGKNIIAGLASGVRAAGQKVVDAALAVVRKVKDLLPGSPVREGPLRSLNKGHAGKEIVRMLADGVNKEAPALRNLMLGITADMASPIAAGPGPLNLASFKPTAAGPVHNIENLNVSIPAADLAEMRGVQDFFNRVQQEARRINPRLKMGA